MEGSPDFFSLPSFSLESRDGRLFFFPEGEGDGELLCFFPEDFLVELASLGGCGLLPAPSV